MRDCGPARTMACDGARGSRPARGRDTRRGVVPQQGSSQSVEHVSAAPRQSPGELARVAFRARRGRAAGGVNGARLATTCPRSDSRESSRTTARLFAAPAPPKIPASWPARGASWAQRARGDAARAACTSTPSTTSGEPHSSFRAWMASSPSRMRISSAAAAAASPTPSPSSALKKSSTYRSAGRKEDDASQHRREECACRTRRSRASRRTATRTRRNAARRVAPSSPPSSWPRRTPRCASRRTLCRDTGRRRRPQLAPPRAAQCGGRLRRHPPSRNEALCSRAPPAPAPALRADRSNHGRSRVPAASAGSGRTRSRRRPA